MSNTDNKETYINKEALEYYHKNVVMPEIYANALGKGTKYLTSPSSVSVLNKDNAVSLSWKDPLDTSTANWGGTLVIRKEGSSPISIDDGTVLFRSTVRNQYAEEPYMDHDVENGKEYFYGIFPYTTDEVYVRTCIKSVQVKEIYPRKIENIKVTNGICEFSLNFGIPDDVSKVKLVYKEGSEPESSEDGTVVDGYTCGSMISCEHKTYYGKIFSYNDKDRETASDSFEITSKVVTFANGTDDEIKKMIGAYYADKLDIKDYWSIGDTRSMKMSESPSAASMYSSYAEKTTTFVIIGFDHDDLVTPINGHTKAAITLWNTYEDPAYIGRMNTSDITNGAWKSTLLRVFLNGTYKNLLPSSLSSILKRVSKVTVNKEEDETTQDYVFLLSSKEVFDGESTEGTQYDYFKVASRFDFSSHGLNAWGLRTVESDSEFKVVNFNGSLGTSKATKWNVILASFCM